LACCEFLLIRNRNIYFALVAAVLLIVAITRFILWTYHIGELAYSSLYTFTRIDGICVGCMLALLMRIHPDFLKKYTSLVVFSIAMLNFGFFFLNHQHAYALPYTGICGFIPALLFYLVFLFMKLLPENQKSSTSFLITVY
jgi:tetrahydromethanopterin S-methyltransferase subunit F